MSTQIATYQPQKILNVKRHCDGGWFWTKYSAYPYLGCYYGCLYCYEWDKKYTPFKNPLGFDKQILIKENAAEILAQELVNKPIDLIMLGDWQPVEQKYRLSRAMLKVTSELGFPVFINEKSPLVVRDLDLLATINQKSYANIGFSIITTQDDATRKIFEPKAPSVQSRFSAMAKIADAGIMTGTVFMPILPFIYDNEKNIQAVVRMTKDAGGKYVLAGNLTLFGYCKERYYQALKTLDPDLIARYDNLYRDHNAWQHHYRTIAKLVESYCQKYHLDYQIPRPVNFFPKKIRVNKLIAEQIYSQVRSLQFQSDNYYQVQAFLKVANNIDETATDILTLYEQEGFDGLKKFPGVGNKMAAVLERVIINFKK
ncbi:MAG: radical SAM protein [candidate division WOR-3 bacterium]